MGKYERVCILYLSIDMIMCLLDKIIIQLEKIIIRVNMLNLFTIKDLFFTKWLNNNRKDLRFVFKGTAACAMTINPSFLPPMSLQPDNVNC